MAPSGGGSSVGRTRGNTHLIAASRAVRRRLTGYEVSVRTARSPRADRTLVPAESGFVNQTEAAHSAQNGFLQPHGRGLFASCPGISLPLPSRPAIRGVCKVWRVENPAGFAIGYRRNMLTAKNV